MDPYLVIVNSKNPFSPDMIKDFHFISTADHYGPTVIEEETYKAFKALCRKLNEKGIALSITSAYRSVEAQQKIYEEIKAKRGEEEANKRVAKPKESEHGLGLGLDVSPHACKFGIVQKVYDNPFLTRVANKLSPAQEAERKQMFKVLHETMAEYGFIYRYKPEKAEFTGILTDEYWHIRYVGPEHAKAMEELNMCLEEYVLYLQAQQENTQEII